MTDISTLNGTLYWDMIRGGAANLYANRSDINALNVFPIPDGDTGDNMYMTVRAGSSATDGNGALGAIASAVAEGMLMGARGNSGVILSRIFAGIAEGFRNLDSADVSTFIKALHCGVRQAYDAVPKPVEGTILTVVREATDYVVSHLTEGTSLRAALALFCEEAARSLEHTPELLPVLKEAGVVDSGGAGLLYIMEGMLQAVDGDVAAAPDEVTQSENALDLSLFTEDSVLEYGYCTEFLLRLQRAKGDIDAFDLPAFTEQLNALGESVVAFRDGSIVKVHVHTMAPSEILAFAQKFGEFLTVKIENMTLQHHGVEEKKKEKAALLRQKPHKPYAVVTVAAGSGIRETFLSMGADAVIDGGQCMNPSASDFVDAFEGINADTILVFPGNSNIILTAEQAAELYQGADVRVIPCRSICETYAALSLLDTSSGDTDAIVTELIRSFGDVVSASVSRANRDTEMNGVTVRSGDYIGFCGDKILSDHADRETATLLLLEKLSAGDYGLLLLICGEDTDAEEANRLYDRLSATYRRTEVILLDGGQPVHDYMIMLE